nr:homeobox protein HAT3.1-like isoform X1 [Tanacetum cinerariifolium]
MDGPSQEQSLQNGLKNHENGEIHKIYEVLYGTPIREATKENQANESSQPVKRSNGQPSKAKQTFTGTPRVLRSRSQEKPKAPEPVEAPSQDAESKEKKRRKKKKIDKDEKNEFSKIKTHLKYLIKRMSYEQNFIDAYVGEGWKGQSLEKLRPEKELERAKSEINRYKLKIRDLFKQIDTSLEEGKFPESLYDSDGLIDSEDIFCSKCAQTDVRLDNDIILCDGACDRGFHQFCLDPPLLKEQVPPGDEGWLCPACDCKVDCVDLINETQGTDLSVNDSWEKVFPESVASGNTLDDNLGLPSDDSEDDDFNPDAPEVDDDGEGDGDREGDGDESSSDESDFSSASEDLGAVANSDPLLGLPSDDSEDDDFNPDKVDPDDDSGPITAKRHVERLDYKKLHDEEYGNTSSDSSDEDFSDTEANMEDDDSGPITAKRDVERLDYKKLHDEEYGNDSSDSSDEDFSDTESNMEDDDSGPITAKRDVERLDYKKLHDEEYGIASSDSSDEDFSDTEANMEDGDFSPITAKRDVERLDYKKLHDEEYGNDSSDSSDEDFSGTEAPSSRKNRKATKDTDSTKKQKENESTPVVKNGKKPDAEGSPAVGSSAKNGTRSAQRRLGEAVTQRLQEVFKENQYPDKEAREKLVEELKITHNQIIKWFGHARWNVKHPGKRTKAGTSTPEPNTNTTTIMATTTITTATPEKSMTNQTNVANSTTPEPNTNTTTITATTPTTTLEKSMTNQTNVANSPTPKSRKRKTKADSQNDNEITPNLKEASPAVPPTQSIRRSGRVQAKRS